MNGQLSSIILIIWGVIILLFRKFCVRSILKYQNKSKPGILKFFEQKLEKKIDWDAEVERRGYPLLEISIIIAGVFFIIIGLSSLIGILNLRP
jgi:hypothetical protein